MNRVRHLRVPVLALLVVSLAVAQTPEPQPISLHGSAKVGEIKGKVTVRLPQASAQPAQPGQVLPAETLIETAKGSVLLSLEDGSQILVKQNSRVVLKAPSQGLGYFLDLLLGKIAAKVQKRFGNAPSFKMGTPTAVITVRGTQFTVEATPNKTIVGVSEGLVAVSNVGAPDRFVLIRPGFSTQVERNRAPEEPRERILRRQWDEREPGRAGDREPTDERGIERESGGERRRESESRTETERKPFRESSERNPREPD